MIGHIILIAIVVIALETIIRAIRGYNDTRID